jgi:hypothetical protein
MPDTKDRSVAEGVFKPDQRREAEVIDALRQEHKRREAAVKNMYRLRALRLGRDETVKAK